MITKFKQLRLISIITVFSSTLLSCKNSSITVLIDKTLQEEGECVYYSDSFSAKNSQNYTLKFSYINVTSIDTRPGVCLCFMKANEWTSSLPFFTNNEATIKVKYNNQLLRRYDGRITNFVSLVETNPMSARNMFAAGDTGDFCSAIYLYHPYKQNKDKIEITLTSAMSCDETTVWLWDYFMDV